MLNICCSTHGTGSTLVYHSAEKRKEKGIREWVSNSQLREAEQAMLPTPSCDPNP
jgi:hypothetical protein